MSIKWRPWYPNRRLQIQKLTRIYAIKFEVHKCIGSRLDQDYCDYDSEPGYRLCVSWNIFMEAEMEIDQD